MGDATARDLTAAAAAAAEGITVDQFVRSRILSTAGSGVSDPADQLLGLMSTEIDVLDDVTADALASREKNPLRTGLDG